VVALFATFPQFSASAQSKFKVLHTFSGGQDGGFPNGGVVRDRVGNLYGTTEQGGDLSCNSPVGCGTVFKLDGSGAETVLHEFGGGSDGMTPYAGVILDRAGNLYGTTSAGGNASCFKSLGCGTVFKLDPNGNETVLYRFLGGTDGAGPIAGLIRDSEGNLYGTTAGGGNSICGFGTGCGTVFKIDTLGDKTLLYTFGEAPDASNPWSEIIRDPAGNLYGTTYVGGDPSCNPVYPSLGCGAVYKLDTTGKESVLYSFTDGSDGELAASTLVPGPLGVFFGTTLYGGDMLCASPGGGCGTVFKIDLSGAETTVYTFTGTPDGSIPQGGLIRDGMGNLYGTTGAGGTENSGTIFKINSKGNELTLHSFSGSTDGGTPTATLAIDSDGNLYGTNLLGGRRGYGTVFKLTP
jgi:uncharacterized repeat protein (TIGR03803 family)